MLLVLTCPCRAAAAAAGSAGRDSKSASHAATAACPAVRATAPAPSCSSPTSSPSAVGGAGVWWGRGMAACRSPACRRYRCADVAAAGAAGMEFTGLLPVLLPVPPLTSPSSCRHAKDCVMLELFGWRCDANCSFCSCCCSCCRRKFYDRRRWTRVTSAWKDLPSDWGQVGRTISLADFEGGGVLVPPRQFVSIYIHSPHPVDGAGEALAARGPFVHEHDSGDVTERDEVLLVRTGAATMGVLPFANSDTRRSDMDGQAYRLQEQHLDPHRVYGFAGKIEYHLLPKSSVPADCVTLCGCCPSCC
eukprot:752546-Hanusia_phi.AAC.6